METESLPRRHFTKGARKLVGFRLPDELKKKMEFLADELGWNVTHLAQTALDQYVHHELEKIKNENPKDGSLNGKPRKK